MLTELKNAVIAGEFGSSRDACVLDARFRCMQSIVRQSRGFVHSECFYKFSCCKFSSASVSSDLYKSVIVG